jgi:hypothetical protein
MKAFLAACILTAGWGLIACTEQASAQFFQPQGNQQGYQPPPVFSPYLNMKIPGNPAINYFGLVKPQIDINRQLQIVQQQQAQQMAMGFMTNFPDEQPLTGYSLTGHPTTFFNYSHYFYNRGGTGGTGGIAGAGPKGAVAAPPPIAAGFFAP